MKKLLYLLFLSAYCSISLSQENSSWELIFKLDQSNIEVYSVKYSSNYHKPQIFLSVTGCVHYTRLDTTVMGGKIYSTYWRDLETERYLAFQELYDWIKDLERLANSHHRIGRSFYLKSFRYCWLTIKNSCIEIYNAGSDTHQSITQMTPHEIKELKERLIEYVREHKIYITY